MCGKPRLSNSFMRSFTLCISLYCSVPQTTVSLTSPFCPNPSSGLDLSSDVVGARVGADNYKLFGVSVS